MTTEPKKTEPMEGAAPVPPAPKAPRPAAPNRPIRRVGSITLGFALIAAGAFFLLFYFWPAFNWQLVLKLAPALALVLLGCEVLYSAARPGRWKYDFLSVFACLALMGGAFCLAFVPVVWERMGPARSIREQQLTDGYIDQLYSDLESQAGQIRLKDLRGNVYLNTVDEEPERLDLSDDAARLYLWVELYGPYEGGEDFAADCRALTDVIRSQAHQPEEVYFYYDYRPEGRPDQELQGGRLELELMGPVQLDWTQAQMAEQVEAEGCFDPAESLPAESEPAAEEPAASQAAETAAETA